MWFVSEVSEPAPAPAVVWTMMNYQTRSVKRVGYISVCPKPRICLCYYGQRYLLWKVTRSVNNVRDKIEHLEKHFSNMFRHVAH